VPDFRFSGCELPRRLELQSTGLWLDWENPDGWICSGESEELLQAA
jgi:hypothetical protein